MLAISDPAMSAVDLMGPFNTWLLSFSNYRHFDETSVINDNQLFFQVIQVERPESNGDRY